MPFKSEAQRKWAYTKEGTKALGGKENVKEWEKATGNSIVLNVLEEILKNLLGDKE